MAKINSVTVAASTYGTLPRVNNWIQSVWNNLEAEIVPKVLVVDDGTPNIDAVKKRAEYCRKFNVQFLHNETNLGIPATWNRIFREAQTDLVVCFNDDIRLLTPGWLSRLIYVFEHNDMIGGVGLPFLTTSGFHYDEARWEQDPTLERTLISPVFATYSQRDVSAPLFLLSWPPVHKIADSLMIDIIYEYDMMTKKFLWLDRDGNERSSTL